MAGRDSVQLSAAGNPIFRDGVVAGDHCIPARDRSPDRSAFSSWQNERLFGPVTATTA